MKTVEEKANEHVNKYDISTIENKTWYRMVMKECFITGHQSALDDESKKIQELEKENTRLKREIEILRLYGNKDCTSMADEVLSNE